MPDWVDKLAGARMQVDQQFQDRVLDSDFSNQEWGLIMTAVEWEVRDPDDPSAAQLVADTSKVEEIIPELEKIQDQMGGGGPMGGGSDGGFGQSIRRLFGTLLGNGTGSTDRERLAEAEELVTEYTRELQAFLEKRERWEDIRESAAAEQSGS